MFATAILSAVLGVSQAPLAAAAPGTCPGAAIATLAQELTAPGASMAKVVIINPGDTPIVQPLTVTAGKATLSAELLAEWQSQASKTPGALRLLWSDNAGASCAQALAAVTAGGQPRSGPPPADLGGAVRPATGDCARDALAWNAALEQGDPKRHRTVLVFRGGNLCYRSDTRRPSAHGDPIYVGVLTNDLAQWAGAAATFTPCDVESAIPSITPGDTFPDLSGRQTDQWVLLTAVPSSCWNDAVRIEIKSPKATAGFVLPQYARYRATVHLGSVFTDQHKETFGLQLVDGTKRIINKGPINNGPEYTASVVFYSVFKYLPPVFGAPAYKGREIRNEQGLFDRIGFMTGVGLKDPTERFVYGFTFEVISGVNVFVGWERAIRNVLPSELDLTKPFTGEEKDLQVEKAWHTKQVVGLTFDLAYAAKLFKK